MRRLRITGLVIAAIALILIGGLVDLIARLTRSLALRAIADDIGDRHDRILVTIEGLLE